MSRACKGESIVRSGKNEYTKKNYETKLKTKLEKPKQIKLRMLVKF